METVTGPDGFDTTEASLNKVKLRLVDVMSELKPLASLDDLGARLRAAAAELHDIERQLLLVMHVREVEDALFDTLDGVDAQLAKGWKPEGRNVDDVVSDLRFRLNT